MDELVSRVFAAVHSRHKLLIRHAEGLVPGVLKIPRLQRTFRIQIAHQPGSTVSIADGSMEGVPDGFLRVGHIDHRGVILRIIRLRRRGIRAGVQRSCNLAGQIAHAGIHPVAGAAFICKPPVDRQNHLVRLRDIVQRFVLIPQPQQHLLAVPLADIDTEFHKAVVDRIAKRIGVSLIAGAFDSDGSLIVFPAGRTPGTVLFFDTKRHTAVIADAIVAACLSVGANETAADTLCRKRPNYAMRSNSVDTVGSLPGMVRAEFGVDYEWTVCISHSVFLHYERGPDHSEPL